MNKVANMKTLVKLKEAEALLLNAFHIIEELTLEAEDAVGESEEDNFETRHLERMEHIENLVFESYDEVRIRACRVQSRIIGTKI